MEVLEKRKRKSPTRRPRIKSLSEVYSLHEQGVDIMLSLPEVSDLFGVNPCSVRYWIKQNKLKAYKLGNLWKVRLSDLLKWMEERKYEEVKSPCH